MEIFAAEKTRPTLRDSKVTLCRVSNDVTVQASVCILNPVGSAICSLYFVLSLHFPLTGFDAYIDCLCRKLSKRIGILNRIKVSLPRTERILYYNSLIKPLILYCSVTWTSCCSHDNINKIFKLRKRYARIILDPQKRHSSVDVLIPQDGRKIISSLTSKDACTCRPVKELRVLSQIT